MLVPPTVVVIAVSLTEARLIAAAPLLTATSILTGLTFSMTATFWSRTIDARRDPKLAVDAEKLTLLDEMFDVLVMTVTVGLLCTGALALTTIFAGTAGAPPMVTAFNAFLLVYMLLLVTFALAKFARVALHIR